MVIYGDWLGVCSPHKTALILGSSYGILRQNRTNWRICWKTESHTNNNHLTSTHRPVHKMSLPQTQFQVKCNVDERNGFCWVHCEIYFSRPFRCCIFARFIKFLTKIPSELANKFTHNEHFGMDGTENRYQLLHSSWRSHSTITIFLMHHLILFFLQLILLVFYFLIRFTLPKNQPNSLLFLFFP